MRYKSIDVLQRALGEGVFGYAKDKKKAAGRALGTFVEIITYYLLKSWGLEKSMAIERGLAEYANPVVTHNVEFSLHQRKTSRLLKDADLAAALTSLKIVRSLGDFFPADTKPSSHPLLSSDGLLKNACTIAELKDGFANAYLDGSDVEAVIFEAHPFAMFECKRVGVEEGMKKGPQTIEKAKQGAYVARTVSALQRVRLKDGSIGGFIERSDGTYVTGEYYAMLDKIVRGEEPELLKEFTLTVGVVSNHGNWFTSENKNKELEVLAQSYDWLVFLCDDGLAEFIEDVVFSAKNPLPSSRQAFVESYKADKKRNRFTKSKIDARADAELVSYFRRNARRIESWFSVIAPSGKSLADLRSQLVALASRREDA